jgi:hypothetical protein
MKRNLELVRKILLQVEKQEPLGWMSEYGSESFNYHMNLLKDGGFINWHYDSLQPRGQGLKENSWQPHVSLTWTGHEFVDAARNDTVWAKLMEKGKDVAIDTALDVLKELTKKLLLGHANE